MLFDVWFWADSLSRQMFGLARELAELGNRVTYVAQQPMVEKRLLLGWTIPDVGKVNVKIASECSLLEQLILTADEESIHVTQGVRNNRIITHVQKILSKRGFRLWVHMETVNDTSYLGFLKRLAYKKRFQVLGNKIDGYLTIGYKTDKWMMSLGMSSNKLYPFAYFMPEPASEPNILFDRNSRFRFLFVGQFISRKRVDFLIDAVSMLNDTNVELAIVGSGPLENLVKSYGEKALGNRFVWLGLRQSDVVHLEMLKANCLVLPSLFDGWGTVVTEAMMVGTPAIVSDSCGSAHVVMKSGFGGIFTTFDLEGLVLAMRKVISSSNGSISDRARLVEWSRRLSAKEGASYLTKIFEHVYLGCPRPDPTWL